MEVKQTKNVKIIIDKDVGMEILKKCGRNCLGTYCAIKSHKNKRYDSCYPSLSKIADECNCSTRTIQRDIAALIDGGFLFVTSGHFKQASNYFFIKESDLYSNEEMQKIKEMMKLHNE